MVLDRKILFLTLAHFVALTTLSQEFLTDEIVYRYFVGLEQEDVTWINSALLLFNGASFETSLGDAYRLPVYIYFQTILLNVFNGSVLPIKLSQILLSSLLIPIAYLICRNLNATKRTSYVASTMVAIWPPLHIYSLNLTGETLSIFFSAIYVLLIILFDKKKKFTLLIIASIIIAVMTLIKSNNLLLIIIFFIYTFLKRNNFKVYFRNFLLHLILITLFISPWSYYISNLNGTFIGTSILGPQAIVNYNGLREQPSNSVIGYVINKFNLTDQEYLNGGYIEDNFRIKNNCKDDLLKVLRSNNNANLKEIEKSCPTFVKQGKELDKSRDSMFIFYVDQWIEKPFERLTLGFAKILHAYGASFRDFKDYSTFLVFLISFIGYLFLHKKTQYKNLSYLYISSFIALNINSFILIGYTRYRVIFFDLIAIVILAIVFCNLIFIENNDKKI